MDEPIIRGHAPVVMDLEAGTYAFCPCGKSAKEPFCDGSHKGTSFKSIKFQLAEPRTVALCACKHSKNMPYCDGSHNRLV